MADASADDYEIALEASGFGWFNIIVLIIGFPVTMAIIFATSLLSYAMTAMKCDVEMSNNERGFMNGSCYYGMLLGGLFWGFASDAFGRKPAIILSHVTDFIFAFALSFCSTVRWFSAYKFLCGICISGGFLSFMTYVSEVHSHKHRARVMFGMGMMLSISAGVLPCMALGILAIDRFDLPMANSTWSNWHCFLCVGSLPSLIVGIAFIFMPESPRFDLTKGNMQRAAKTITTMRKMAFKKEVRANEEPIKLANPSGGEKQKKFDWKGIKESFTKRNIICAVLIFLIEFFALMCQNTMRLWQPVMIAVAEEDKHDNFTIEFCSVVDLMNKPPPPPKQCHAVVKPDMYYSNFYSVGLCLIAFIISIVIVKYVGIKIVLISFLFVSFVFVIALRFIKGMIGMVFALGLFLSAEFVIAAALMNAIAQIFPTNVRNTVLSVNQIIGRLGSIIGNHVFPLLFYYGCDPPIIWLALSVVENMKLSDTMATPIEEKLDQNLKQQVRSGMVHVSDGKSRPEPLRLSLTMEVLTLQKLEIVTPTSSQLSGPPMESKERMVQITRQKQGGLGLSIKGGAEHKLPILISRIYKDQAADITGQLFVGDAIIKVNGEYITACPHDDAVNILRNAGDIVVLTVKHYRAATPFLQKQLTKDTPDSDNDVTCAELKADEGYKSSVNSGTISRSCSRPMSICSEPEKRWTDVVAVPLMMAYVTRYIYGTDKLRPNAFEVRGLNGVNTGVIHCDELAILSQWLKLITDNVVGLTHLQMKLYNRNFAVGERIEYMGWVNEGVINNNISWQSYKPRFLLLKGTEVMLFETPPLNVAGISKALVVYKVYQTMFRIIKESETVDSRQHCFLLQSSGHEPRYLSVETRQELLRIENSWNAAIVTSVIKLGRKTFAVSHHGKSGGLTLDWQAGFSLTEGSDASIVWQYKFSQLRGSSDDGKSKLKLHFQDAETRAIETKELECQVLQSLLYCMHAFLTAKVASVDPAFLSSIQQT